MNTQGAGELNIWFHQRKRERENSSINKWMEELTLCMVNINVLNLCSNSSRRKKNIFIMITYFRMRKKRKFEWIYGLFAAELGLHNYISIPLSVNVHLTRMYHCYLHMETIWIQMPFKLRFTRTFFFALLVIL